MLDDKRLSSDPVPVTVSYRSIPGAAADHGAGEDHQTSSAVEDLPRLHSRILGDFVLGEVIGRGGCGTVYRAEQRTLGRPVVVKVIHVALAARRDAAERFVREARLASRFDHPYAAHIYSFGVEHDGVMWIAMELVDGMSLGQLVRQSGPLPLDRFVGLFERLCDVVQSAHDQGIVHRDIKPSNVMVIERAGRLMPKLLDFGIAKLINTDVLGATQVTGPEDAEPSGSRSVDSHTTAQDLTHQGQVLGSPTYMAPEQWRNAMTAGPLADQYALALVAYEALTGSRAFAGSTMEALAEEHRSALLPALPAHLPGILHAVLARACDKLPERRFANLTELAVAIRDATVDAAGDLDASIATGPDEGSPYPGLAPYAVSDHASFVGREREAEELLDQLQTQSIVTIVGPSGSGKTSFLAAGLIPSLPRGWCAELVRPGGDPPDVLAAIAAQRDTPPYREGPSDKAALPVSAIASALVGLAESRGTMLVLIIDQGEELFTMCTDEPRRVAFAEILVAASVSPRVRVVLALRDDFLCSVERLPAWRGLLGRAVRVLGVPGRADLERMITVPARRRGFAFDDPALAGEIVDQIADRPGALPLVAFTAAQLWAHRDRRSRQLTRDAYVRLGGVIGALVQHADSVVDRMPIPDRRQVRLIFRRLITAEGVRALISRSELESSLGGQGAATVVDRLLAARLIVSRDDDTGDRIEVIHETLATTWPRLAAWRRADADGAWVQERLAVAARHWNERRQPTDLLWRGEALADLRRWQDSGDHNMTSIERAFARASIATAARARRARIAIVAAIFALLVAGLVGMISANREIAVRRTAAVDRLRASFEERGRLAIGDGDAAKAMLFLAEASRLGAHGSGFDLLASQSALSLDAGLEIVGRTSAGIMAMDLGPLDLVTLGSDRSLYRWDRAGKSIHLADQVRDAALIGELVIAVSTEGELAATDRSGIVRWRAEVSAQGRRRRPLRIAGSTAAHLVVAFRDATTLWDAESGRSLGELPHDQDVHAVAFDDRGERIATGDNAGVVRIWDTAKLQLLATCASHGGTVRDLKFAADQSSVVSGGNDGEVRICDAASGATLHRLIGHSHQVLTVDVASDGRAIVSGGGDGEPRIWDSRTGLLVSVLEGHQGTVTSVQFSPDGGQILTLGFDGTARLWNRDGVALGSLQGHGHIHGGRWDADGDHVITTSSDGAIRRWQPARTIKTAFQQAHSGPIAEVLVSDNNRWLLTASLDGRATLWDRRSLHAVAELVHDGSLHSIMFGADDTSALAMDEAGNTWLWQVPSGILIRKLGPGITAAAYAHDGTVITASAGKVTFWDAAGVERSTVAIGYQAHWLVLDPTGRWLFVGGKASSIQVIDMASGTPSGRLWLHSRQAMGVAIERSRIALVDGATIRLWQIGSWVPLGTLAGHKDPVRGIWFLPDGRLVSTASDATRVWGRDAALAGTLDDTNALLELATSPDGALIATTSSDGAIRIWDPTSYRLLLQLPAHRLPASALQFTPDGATVISGGNDGRLVTWDLERRGYTASQLATIVQCRVPLRLDGEAVQRRDLDFDDPTCRSVFDR